MQKKVRKRKPNLFKEQFKSSLKESDRPPFLFIGSGVSIRYSSVPTWMNLLKGFVEDNKECFSYDFGYYSSKCSNDPMLIASQLAEEFHEYWWQAEKYLVNREKHSHVAGQDVEMAFKIELCSYVEQSKRIREGLESEIDLIGKSVVSGVLTTNWDNFIQDVFNDFQVQIGQKEALFADQKSIGELYKVHGCVSKPESIIVTQKDYSQFIKNNHYLNAKLLTLFAEYPIIFMGYSLSDPNIELILKNLITCLDNDFFQVEKLQNRLFFVEWTPEPTESKIESSTYTLSSVSIPLMKIRVHDFIDIWTVLSELPRTLPVKTLRQLQNMVYEFVTTSKATKKILVHGMDELDKIEDLEVVVGFGNISKLEDKGIIGLKSKDLLADILMDSISESNYPEIVEKLLPSVIKKNVYVPFFKYQKATNNLNVDNSLKDHFFDNYTLTRSNQISIEDYRIDSGRARNTSLVSKYGSLKDLIQDCSAIHAIQRIPYFDESKLIVELDVLRAFLTKHWDDLNIKDHIYSSHYRKCICLLDYLKNANQN